MFLWKKFQLATGARMGHVQGEDQSFPSLSPLAGGETGTDSSISDQQQPQIHVLHGDPKWTRTKRVGLSLCFMSFILMGTVAAKFIIQGPSIIDTSRRGQIEDTAYFFFSELLFVALAMALFFTGVACLRNRTNDYLLRQFNQHILSNSARAGIGGGAMNDFIDYYDTHHTGHIVTEDEESQDNLFLQQHHHHHPHSHPSEILLPSSESRLHPSVHHHHHSHHNANCRHSSHFIIVPERGGGSNGGHRSRSTTRHGGKPPPYHIALYLPLPSQEDSFVSQETLNTALTDKTSDTQGSSSREKTPGTSNDPDGLPETPPPSYDQFKFHHNHNKYDV